MCAVATGSARALAVQRAREAPEAVGEAKARYLDAAVADGRGGEASTGWRYWLTYCCDVLCCSPLQPRGCSWAVKAWYSLRLEDCAVWILEDRPSGNFVSVESIRKYVSTIRATHKRKAGTLGLGRAEDRVSDLLQGARRLVPQPPKKVRLGCTPDDLRLGCERRLGDGSATSLMWRAAFEFGFGALARGCEFALDSDRGEEFEASEHLTPDDVSFFTTGGARHAKLSMRKRKDLRVLRGKQATVVLAGGGSVLDPPRALQRWLDARERLGLSRGGPLFCHPDGRSITVQEVRDELREVLRAAGRRPELYGAHSLRIGGATAALAAGVPPALIRLMGRWSSDVYEIYCRMSVEAALQVGAALTSQRVVSTFEGFKHEELELRPAEVQFIRVGENADEPDREEEEEEA